MRICIVGLGNMGQSMFEALERGRFDIVGCERKESLMKKSKDCDVVIIAVKPQSFDDLSKGVSLEGKLVISIMAGVNVEKISKAVGSDKVIRVMPNLPLQVGSSFSGWFASESVLNEEKEKICNILMSFGTQIEVYKEDDIDKITALSGSGPAYYYYLNRSLRMKAMEMGFSEEQAREIVRGTFLGAARLFEESGECSGKLISRISSKGGTTEAAVNYMDHNGVEEIFGDAVEAAYKRAKELND